MTQSPNTPRFDARHDVVVVGAGISGLTAAYRIQRRLDVSVLVLEAGPRVGGTATTDHVGGFTIDRGPNGFVASHDATWRLSHELGILDELRPASTEAAQRFIFMDGSLHPISPNPLRWLRSDLLSVRGRMRAALEVMIPPTKTEDESVWQFFARRFGREFADTIGATAVIGVAGGDARRLSMRALFPRFVELEQQHSSVVRGALARQLGRLQGSVRRQLSDESLPASPPGGTMSFGAAGIGRLASKLAAHPGLEVRVDSPVANVDRLEPGGFIVRLANGQRVRAEQVVLAVPAYVAGQLVGSMAPELSAALDGIEYASMSVVTLGYENRSLERVPHGYGFLVRRGQGIRMLGCQWTGSIFPEQVPAQHSVYRCLFGGSFDAPIIHLERGKLFRVAESELSRIHGVRATPILRHTITWPRAIPQYTLGHRERVRTIESRTSVLRGLHLAGNAYYGISINDCVADADRVATQVVMEARGTPVTVPVRAVSGFADV